MTDTTAPTVLTIDVLTGEQQQRAKALDLARTVLVHQVGGLAPRSGPADPMDLVNIASWITTGIDPYLTPEERADSHAYLDKLQAFFTSIADPTAAFTAANGGSGGAGGNAGTPDAEPDRRVVVKDGRVTVVTGREGSDTEGPRAYRKKPVTVHAMQWDGTNPGAGPIIDWAHARGVTVNYWAPGEWDADAPDAAYLTVDTLEGRMLANPGDWIIQGVAGEFYPCRADIFAETYEEEVEQ
ncbi:hypothetical protein L5G28_07595 [Gordonia sp. HY285]|uniref:hypothetical protein n=1 Tax=Gordonia liuliyuniae TaxID=2911517 RepID=UPI001F437148|nr:hypothetical protein [Gordonia liuliyuniae]MCF8610024.1 hypothetical protein [Gordonia liuliyuniae]